MINVNSFILSYYTMVFSVYQAHIALYQLCHFRIRTQDHLAFSVQLLIVLGLKWLCSLLSFKLRIFNTKRLTQASKF